MKIVLQEVKRETALAFCFYNNSREELERSLKPWIPHIDHVIAINGRFKLPYSPEMLLAQQKNPQTVYGNPDAQKILLEICGDKLWFETIYGTQTEKRQRAFDVAGKLGVDVLIVWDSDDYIHPDYTDFETFYRKIAVVTEYNTDEMIYWMNAWIPDEQRWSKQHNHVPSNAWRRYMRIHFKPAKQKYVLNHFTFTNKDTREEDIIKYYLTNGPEIENPLMLYPHITIDGVRLTTDRDFRTESQNDYGNSWTWQWLQEEKYRQYIAEFKVMGLGSRATEHKMGTYYYDKHGVLVPYTADQQELHNSLEL